MVALKPREVERFLAAPDTAIDAILVYGPDRGLVAERTARLLAHYAVDPHDPFSVSYMDEAELGRDPQRLTDELNGLALGPGRRTVVVRAGGGAGGEAVGAALDGPRAGVLLVEAGELRPTAALRKAFERARGAAAIACYSDDGRDVARLIDTVLAAHGQTIEPAARQMLAGRLGADRLVSRGEIEKLCLYAGQGARITLDDVEAACADAAEASLDQVVDAMAAGRADALEAALASLSAAGVAPAQAAAASLAHLQRLHRMAGAVGEGASPASVVAGARPPIHFSRRTAFEDQLARWSEAELRRALFLAGDAERASRGDQALAATAVARLILQIALLPRSTRR